MRVLLVKMSSLGDLVHTLPAITDAAAQGVVFDWVVEEAFTAIAEKHPAVQRVLPIAWRRWRRSVLSHRGELAGFFSALRSHRYDLVIDAQGLWKSSVVAAAARSDQTWGFDRASAREGTSTLLYRRHVAVARDQHAIDRQRRLFAGVLGYPLPDTPPESGIETNQPTQDRNCVLCHGTTWASKHWPEPMWQELSRTLQGRGYRVLLPAGNESERQRAVRIAEASGAQVLPTLPLASLMETLATAELVVGVDSGLSHLAAALGTRTVTLYGSTDAALTGCRGQRVVNLQADFACSPCRLRSCNYAGSAEHWQNTSVTPACFSRITPDQVLRTIEAL
jgi:heptosyltransferase-1